MHAHLRHDRRRGQRFLAVLWIAFGATLLAGPPLHAANAGVCCTLPREQDAVWLVSCRGMGCGNFAEQATRLGYWRYDRAGGWSKSSLADFLATDDPAQVTTVFLHGNRIPWAEAFTKGWIAYQTLVCGAGSTPVRFVIWSWPSEPIRGLVADAREKAARTDRCGYHLAWFLDQMNPDVPVSLWGHSFGARIATGALHLLGGGSLHGTRLDNRVHPTREPMRVALLAAAIDSEWLLPGQRQGRAMSQMTELLLVNNSCDALLKRYRLLYCRRSNAQAVGYTGLAVGWLSPADRGKVTQVDACCQVGKRHVLVGYTASPDLITRVRDCLLPDAGQQAEPQEVAVASSDEPTQIE